MKNLLLISSILLLFVAHSFGQNLQKPSAAEIKTLPVWAQEMYAENPNVFVVEQLYTAYFAENTFVKSYHTQYYKRWRRAIDHHIDENGFVKPLSVEELQKSDFNYQNKLRERETDLPETNPVWSTVGPYQVYNNNGNPANEQTNVYAIDQCTSAPNVLYCGTEPGEVYKSTDTANSWTCVSLSQDFGGGVSAIEVNPTNATTVFAGSGRMVKRSTDGGLTWTTVLNANNLNVNEILIYPANTQIVLVATDLGLYRSSNGGTTFTLLFTDKSFDLKVKPGSGNTIYLVKDNPTLQICQFFKSTNAGATWNLQSSGWFTSTDPARYNGGARIGVTPADTNRVYAYLIGEAKTNDFGFIGVYRSNDGGTTWTLPNAPAGGPYTAAHPNLAYGYPGWTYHQGFYNCALMVSATDADKILVGGLNLWRSNDGGLTFNPVSGYVGGGNLDMHVDMQDFRRVGNNYWITTDGGIYTSPDFFASTAEPKNAGIRGSDYWGFGSGWNDDILVGGLYHNGNIAYNENYGAGNFLALGGGEAPTGYVNPGNNLKTYFSDIGGRFLPNTLTGSVTSFGIGLSPNESYYSAESSEMEFYPDCYNIAFIGNENKLWKTTDGGASYNLVKTFGNNANNQIKYIEISRSNPLVMYVNQQPQMGSTGTLWKTADGGATWTSLTLPAGYSRRMLLALDFKNENILWLSYPDGADGSKIYKTTNGGNTWINLTTSMLDGEYANSISCIPNTNGGIYFCSGRTVFYRNNSLPNWQIVNTDLPAYFNSNISRPFYRDGKMRIASYGKGIWESNLYDQPTAPIAQITVDKLQQTVICETDSFRFEDFSVLNHTNATWQWTFQNGVPATSTLRNPTVYFATAGTHLAILTVTDGNGISDSDSLQITVSAFVPQTTVQEDFEGSFPPAVISITNPEKDAQWSLSSTAGGFGSSAQSAIFDNYNYDSQGAWDDMRVSVNFTNPQQGAKITFDVAHAPYGGQYTDTLEVLASADCGATFTRLYKKWGATLATAPNNTNFFNPAITEWRTDTLNLSAFVGTPHLMVAFRNIGLWGNAIYIDNINILSSGIGIHETPESKLEIFPNPVSASGFLNITNPQNEKIKVTLLDGKGSVVFKTQISSTAKINLSSYALPAGIYLVNLMGETKIVNFKLMVE